MQPVPTVYNPAYAQLLRVAQGMGLLKWVDQGKFSNIKIAFLPFVTTKAYHGYLGQLQEIWHRVLLKVAQDRQFLIDTLGGIAESDQLLHGVFKIFLKRGKDALLNGIILDRIDYYNNEEGQPKLTEYNLQCVGMMSHMERFQDAKRLTDGENEYVSCTTVDNFSHAVKEIWDLKKLEGVMLFVVYSELEGDANFLDQARLEIAYRKKGLKIIRTTLKEMAIRLVLKENGDLFFGEEKVGIVYYRGVYKIAHYKFGEGYDVEKSWQVREKVALSNAISIPPIEFELINLKRVQTELGKPEVLKKYASEEDAAALMQTRVGEWEFDSISEEELSVLTKKVEANLNSFLLKPNRQGGGNNLFGDDVLLKLRGDRQTLRNYILMQKIKTRPTENIIITGFDHRTELCEYQVSRYGTLTWLDGKIVRNQADGFLVRAKPPTANEGGIMTGVGSIVSWKVTE